jgi:hypothetical protein
LAEIYSSKDSMEENLICFQEVTGSNNNVLAQRFEVLNNLETEAEERIYDFEVIPEYHEQ